MCMFLNVCVYCVCYPPRYTRRAGTLLGATGVCPFIVLSVVPWFRGSVFLLVRLPTWSNVLQATHLKLST